MHDVNAYGYAAYLAHCAAIPPIVTPPITKEEPVIDTVEISAVAEAAWGEALKKQHEDNISNQKDRKYPFSYKYFENHDCEFWPCHPDASNGHNCMFCRCPLYSFPKCIGIRKGYGVMLENGLKDCTNCTYNHDYDNAELMSRSK